MKSDDPLSQNATDPTVDHTPSSVQQPTVDHEFHDMESDAHQQTTVEGFSSSSDSSSVIDQAASNQSKPSSARYERQHLHATGGIGQVWVARDSNIQRDVALKELRADRLDSPSHRDRFLFEAQVTGQLEHPGVVPVYDVHADSVSPSYTMRFFRGRTLKEALDEYHQRQKAGQAEPVEFADLLNAFISICNTLEYAHSRGVIHRDLKGQNVVLGNFGEVIVLDWGLAKHCDAVVVAEDNAPVSADSSSSTQVGAVVGTPAYMSPEQACGQSDQVGPATDIYALGVILFELLTGRPPFQAETTIKLLQKVIHEKPPVELLATAPPPLAAICVKALSKQPEDRFVSARELANDVRRYLADEPVRA
ncbi:MAG: serine/threonine-protein kinase, partial [Planctomycetota bacterium]|nr:serine/threonine-protein kinase [Planctomycetota bacterium]